MTIQSLLLYTCIVTGILYCPGPMTLFSLGTSTKLGFKSTLPAIIGGSFSYVVMITLTAYGLGLVLQHSLIWFEIIKWLGVSYLIYLGIKQWCSDATIQAPTNNTPKKCFKLFMKGFLVGLSNPKAILVFTALFPHFIQTSQPVQHQFFVLGVIFIILQLSSAMAYAAFGAQLLQLIKSKGKEKLQQIIIGSLLICAGLALGATKE